MQKRPIATPAHGKSIEAAAQRSFGPLLAVAAVAGGLIGSWLGSRRLGSPAFRRLLGVVLVIAAAKMLWVK